ncbi:excalibur calcium-binding domain-containing protein [Marinobacter mangrovi]|uniref:excalibur calcium-binding domain-containing protein n=1 Tax=Marinobacter mangrovi TaxID=2803918 RepID=UPI001933A6E5|nr:excalibur calcium-binding domain-containing protein [Marinobacter mangrovi]
MKNLLIVALIAAGIWTFLKKNPELNPLRSEPEIQYSTADTVPNSRFSCDGRQYCGQMTSRAEAEFFTRHCPNTKMDGDHDGIPCENDTRF